MAKEHINNAIEEAPDIIKDFTIVSTINWDELKESLPDNTDDND